MAEPPVGTIALLFTDIESSTRLAREAGDGWADVLAEHHRILRGAIEGHGGYVDGTEGDAFFATFADAKAGVDAAVAAQRALSSAAWPHGIGALRVRMGVHTGFVERSALGYVSIEVHRAARVGAAAAGGQILVTSTTRALLGEDTEIEDLGEHRLKDFPSPERLFNVVYDGRRAAEFGPPRTAEARPTNLPEELAPLVGRDSELDHLSLLLGDGTRFVTLVGAGGAGKTRLALSVGRRLLDDLPGGAFVVPLAPVLGPEGVLPAVARALDLADDEGELMPRIAARLGERRSLLVLDNFEQILRRRPGRRRAGGAQPRAARARHQPGAAARARGDRGRARGAGAGRRGDAVRRAGAGGRAGLEPPPGRRARDRRRVRPRRPAAARDRARGGPCGRARAGRPARAAWRHRPTCCATRRATRRSAIAACVPRSSGRTPCWSRSTRRCSRGSARSPAPCRSTPSRRWAGRPRSTGSRRWWTSRSSGASSPPCYGWRFTMPQALRDFAREKLAASGEEAGVRRRHAEHVLEVARASRIWFAVSEELQRRLLAIDAELRPALAWAESHDAELYRELVAGLGLTLMRRGFVREVISYAERVDPRLDETGVWIANCHAYSLLMAARLDEAEARLEPAIAVARERHDDIALGLLLHTLCWIADTLHQERALDDRAGEPRAAARATRGSRGARRIAYVQALIDLGRIAEAEAAIDDLLPVLDRRIDGDVAGRHRAARPGDPPTPCRTTRTSLETGRARQRRDPGHQRRDRDRGGAAARG